jgi:hypothetical protein
LTGVLKNVIISLMVILSVMWRVFKVAVFTVIVGLLLTRSVLPPADQLARIRMYTRGIEFDYVSWVIESLAIKLSYLSLGTTHYLPEEYHSQFNYDYLALLRQIQTLEGQVRSIYADPGIADPAAASAHIRLELEGLYDQRSRQAPIAEAILQRQVAGTATGFGLTFSGQPVPPVLYRSTPLPLALIISPREAIRQEYDISLIPELTVDEQAQLEEQVDQGASVSSLVVPIGGVGLYPTMVMETSDIAWLAEVVAHEWIHNYLTVRPLGMSYLNSPELRTMNETAAAIAGKEIGLEVQRKFYPESLAGSFDAQEGRRRISLSAPEQQAFDFRAEMRLTRVTVDQMLAEGRVEEAEGYMEERRRFFWDNGFRLRKLNQAYFAFYGAYADQPGGAAGEDPVGAAVRTLRQQSASLKDFLTRIAWMTSFDQLQRAVDANQAEELRSQ